MIMIQIALLIALFFSFASVILVVNSRASEGQKWMLISTISIFVYVSQLYFGLYSTSIEMIMATRKIINSCCIFLVLSAALGISYICDIRIHRTIKQFYVAACSLCLPLVWSINHHSWWYKSYEVEKVETEYGVYLIMHPVLGPMFYIINAFLLASFAVWMVYSIFYIAKRKGTKARTIRTFALCLFFPSFTWFLAILGVFNALYASVFMILGLALSIVILQYRYNITETVPIAKEQVVESTDEGVIILDRYGQYVFANTPAKTMFPIFAQDNVDKNDFIEKKLSEDTLQMNGRFYEIHTEAVINSGKRHGSIIWVRDVTEDEKVKEHLINLKVEADNANSAKSNFLANMSHEIRTPINAVIGFDEMILRETEDENIVHYAEGIRESGQALLYIINDILDLSKIESGKMTIIDVEYDLGKVLDEMLTMVAPRAAASSNQIIYHIDSNIPKRLFGDEIRIRQVITNLLTNAVKYTDAGSVELNVTLNSIEDGNANIRVSVSDTGTGIRPEELKDLFDAFKRADEVRNRNVEGAGLGLNITSSILSLMGSELNVKSTYGEGSDFSFIINQKIIDESPIGDFDEIYRSKEKNTVVKKTLLTAPGAKVLVVDDNVLNIEVFKGLLRYSKIDITTANSGIEALELLVDNEFDLLFLDHKMPKMDGIETLHRIKETKELANRPMKIVALTANAIMGAREMYINEGFDDYLMKPIIWDDLERLLKAYLYTEMIEKEAVSSEKKETTISVSINPDNSQNYDVSHINVENLSDDQLIDTKSGLAFCGNDKEIYNQLADVFIESRLDDELMQYYNLEDWDNYEVIAHSVKSNAKTIGANFLSEYAKAMEYALKYGKDVDFIKAHHEEFVSFYQLNVGVLENK